MTDKERNETVRNAYRDSKLALERAKSKLENATLEYLYAIDRFHHTVSDYLSEIEKLLDKSNE